MPAILAKLRLPAIILIVVAVAIQLVPYGRDHENPPVVADAPWTDAEARSIAVSACYDCHSNQTRWPLYAQVAPSSWLVTRDVEDGRLALNFSEWPRDEHQLGDAIDVVEDDEMPPRRYLLLHPDARLSSAERARLIEALRAMRSRSGSRSGRGGR